MSRGARVSALVALALLVVAGLLLQPGPRERSATSFGRSPDGFAALHEWLEALGLATRRSFVPAPPQAEGRTVWWLAPDLACGPGDPAAASRRRDAATRTAWVAAGGHAVFFLAPAGGEPACAPLAGLRFPERAPGVEVPEERVGAGADDRASGAGADPEADAEAGDAGDADAAPVRERALRAARKLLDALEARAPDRAPDEGADASDADPHLDPDAAPAGTAPAEPAGDRVEGPLVAAARRIPCDPEAAFLEVPPGWEVVARRDGTPFALARRHGHGRVLVLASAAFVSNACLDRGDAAPLAADLVRAHGAPWLDERMHGLRARRGALATIATSPALAFFCGVALLGLLHVWRGTAFPRRALPDDTVPAPAVEEYVDALAALYAGTGDHGRVLERYRELTLARLRRGLGLPPATPRDALVARLRRRGDLAPEGLAELTSGATPRSARELAEAVARLERLRWREGA